MLGRFVEGGQRFLEGLGGAGFEGLADGGGPVLDELALRLGKEMAGAGEGGLHLREELFRFHFGLGEDALVHVFEGVLERILQHFLDGFVAHIDGAGDLHGSLLAGLGVAGEDVEDAVGVDLELHADAGLAFGRGLEFQLEAAEGPIVAHHLALALQHVDEHRALAGDGVGEHLAGLARDGGLRGMITFIRPPKVSMPSESGVTSRSTTFCTAPERMPAWMVAPRATASSGFCEVLGSLAENLGDEAADERHARLAADEDDFVEVLGLEAGIGQRAAAVGAGALDDRLGEALEFGAGKREGEATGAVEKGEGRFRPGLGGKAVLGGDGGFAKAGSKSRSRSKAGHFAEMQGQGRVDVVAAEAGVAVGGEDLEDALVELEDGDVEGAAAEIEDGDARAVRSLSRP